MVFNSIEFFVFAVVVLTLYWTMRRRAQNALLLIASYVFYGWWDYRFLALIAISTLSDFYIAGRCHRSAEATRRKAWLFGSLGVNLGILAAFKYYGFFVETAAAILESIGLTAHLPTLQVILPVGISFYTFQTISYTFDVYRNRIEPESNLITFAAYVAFFPQLVAGPIERAQSLLPQLRATRRAPDLALAWSAGWLILTGLFKKVVLADGLALIVEQRFASPDQHGGWSLLLGVYAFAIQIYGDFSGYSSIARGVARLFGIELIRNFEQPYLSTNISQFWRTWHMSLSTWLWDYLYVPLGGNRGTRRRTYINLMLTMLLGGLWHGAAWTFVVWGGIHGSLLAIHRACGAYVPRGAPTMPRFGDMWKVLCTFHLVALAWIPFRADSLGAAGTYVTGLTRLGDTAPGETTLLSQAVLVGIMAVLTLALDWADRGRHRRDPIVEWNPILLGAAAAIMVLGIIAFAGGAQVPFIYFQF